MMANEPFSVPDGYARTKIKPQIRVRTMTLDELRTLGTWGKNHAEIVANDGTLRRVAITSVKTWKTRPGEIEVRMRYGLKEYASFNTQEALARIVVRVGE